jgi:lambda family phage portal protein
MIANGKKSLQDTFDSIRADYDMSRSSRFVRKRNGVAPQGSGADYHYRTETQYYRDIEQARDMDRNDAVVGILADRRVDNIVQSGFKLDPKTGDKGLDLELWERWQDYANDPEQCDIAGECTWSEIERHCARSESIDGDIIVTGTEDGSFQVLESHVIQTKSRFDDTFLGVTTDRYGKRLQYHILEELDAFGTKGDSTPIDVRDSNGRRQVFHVYNPKRVMQTRGVTQLAPVFSYAGMLEDINFAKLVQQQVVSCFAILEEVAAGSSGLPSVAGFGRSTIETSPTGTRQIEGVSPGMKLTSLPGHTLKGFSPNVPNSEYFEQVKLIMQVLGVNFGLPLCLVLMDGSETNFSGWRGAVDEARKGFVADQLNLVRRLHKPAYEWWLSRLIEEDSEIRSWRDKPKIKLFGHNWNLPTWSYIEPVADAEGDATQLRNALTSPRRLHSARGGDWEETADEIIEDNIYAIDKAAKKASEFNVANPTSPPLNWRDLIPLVMPEGQTIALQDPEAIAVQADAAGGAGDGASVDSQEHINVEAQALNSAQVTSLMDVVTQVGTGAMPKETAIAVINAAFPTLSPEQVAAIIDPIQPGSVTADGVPAPAVAGSIGVDGKPVPQQDAGSEMLGVKRSDWKNSRKAIKDILQEMIAKTISEQRARLELDSLGIPPSKVDLYITDALDGQVDTPEVIADA